MPCIIINYKKTVQPIVSGDVEIGTGTSNFRDAPI